MRIGLISPNALSQPLPAAVKRELLTRLFVAQTVRPAFPGDSSSRKDFPGGGKHHRGK
jgi:hypothetical protein